MITANQLIWDDTVLPFQLDNADVRWRVARLDGALQQILDQHDYPLPVAELVAEAVLLTAMIGQTIGFRWKLSLQIRGDGPIRLIATDFYAAERDGEPAKVRAYASFDKDRLADAKGAPFENIGKGMFAVLIDQGAGMQPYQGITPLAGGSLAACAETYFAQSEQLPTKFSIAVGESSLPGEDAGWRGGAVMLQHMPKASPYATGTDVPPEVDADSWNRVSILLDSVEVTELVGPHVSPDTLLVRLFHEEAPRIFDAQAVKFGCTCGPEKVEQTMSIYSAKDIGHMTNDEGKVTADCQFCGAHYEFEPEALGKDAKR
ncbi:MAG: Hsp33 family molecular chaperone HslO [Alphaproteobacteria bacterium]